MLLWLLLRPLHWLYCCLSRWQVYLLLYCPRLLFRDLPIRLLKTFNGNKQWRDGVSYTEQRKSLEGALLSYAEAMDGKRTAIQGLLQFALCRGIFWMGKIVSQRLQQVCKLF